MDLLKKVIWCFRSIIIELLTINICKTIIFNFKYFDLKTAIKFPVLIFGSVKLSLRGKVKIESPIKRGMIVFGKSAEVFSRSKKIAEINIHGTLVFKGGGHFSHDCRICIKNTAYVEFGNGFYIGSDVSIVSFKRIQIGESVRITYQTQVMDTNYHYILNIEEQKVGSKDGEIYIGDYNWIGNRSSIMKGTVTPDRCIVASNSICNKDYTKYGEFIIIGGSPAKFITKGYARIFDNPTESLLNSHFSNEVDHYKLSDYNFASYSTVKSSRFSR